MKIVMISHLFPNKANINSGIFVKEQVKAILKTGKAQITAIIAPLPFVPPFLDRIKQKWSVYKNVPKQELVEAVEVLHPRYAAVPLRRAFWTEGIFLGFRLLSFREKFRNCDVIHAHCLLPDGLAGLIVTVFYKKVRLICTAHGSDVNIYPGYNRLTNFFTRLVARKAELILCVSDTLRKKLIEMEPRTTAKTLYNGIDPYKFSVREEAGDTRKETSCTILFVGAVSKAKGVFDLIAAFSILQLQVPEAKLIIVGKYDEQEIADYRKNKTIEFVGQVSNEQICNFMNRAEFFVLPSYHEGLPTVMLEAMACRLPMILTTVGGIPEIVSNGVSALLVEPGDIAALAKAMITMASDKRLRCELSTAAYHKLVEDHTWAKSVEKLIFIYEKAMQNREGMAMDSGRPSD